MADLQYRAIEVSRAGYVPALGDVVIVASLSETDELHLGFPADDIPNLMLLLSRIYAQNISGQDADGSLGLVTPVDSARFLPGPDGESVALFADLSAGTPISLGFSRATAVALRDQLNSILGTK